MSDEVTPLQRAKQMRELSDEVREAFIAASDNVIGFERVIERRKQVELARAYRSPKNVTNPGPRTA